MTTLPDDWWTTEDVATFLSITASTVRAYVARNQMPKPDRQIGRTQVWKPETIRTWHEGRPRQAASPAETHTD
jgi:predicted DNA-binding transcriptional regulator AlpA